MPLASDVGGFNFGRNAVAGFKTLCRWRYINPRRAGTRSSVVPGVDISLLAAYTLATLLTFIHCLLYTICVDTFERCHCWPTLTHKCISKGLLNWYACIVYISVYKLYI